MHAAFGARDVHPNRLHVGGKRKGGRAHSSGLDSHLVRNRVRRSCLCARPCSPDSTTHTALLCTLQGGSQQHGSVHGVHRAAGQAFIPKRPCKDTAVPDCWEAAHEVGHNYRPLCSAKAIAPK